jgi:hypothetical protein
MRLSWRNVEDLVDRSDVNAGRMNDEPDRSLRNQSLSDNEERPGKVESDGGRSSLRGCGREDLGEGTGRVY